MLKATSVLNAFLLSKVGVLSSATICIFLVLQISVFRFKPKGIAQTGFFKITFTKGIMILVCMFVCL